LPCVTGVRIAVEVSWNWEFDQIHLTLKLYVKYTLNKVIYVINIMGYTL